MKSKSNKTIVKLSEEDVFNLRILFTYLAGSMSKEEKKLFKSKKQLPKRLRVLRSIMKQTNTPINIESILCLEDD